GTAADLVVPKANTDVEGGSNLIWLLQGVPTRIQTVIGASELTRIPYGGLITGVAWRLLGSEPWPTTALTCASYRINVSTSLHPPHSLSVVFAENIGGDETTVFDSSLTIQPFAYPVGTNPNAFGPTIVFSTPFVYRAGDLLIDIEHSGSGDFGY